MLEKVISGGQDGVGVAALRAAKAAGIPTGGCMPTGFLTASGPRPEYATLYGMQETKIQGYPALTERNIEDASATLILTRSMDILGRRLAWSALLGFRRNQEFRPWYMVEWGGLNPVPAMVSHTPDVLRFLRDTRARVLNVAGDGDKALEEPVEAWLRAVFADIAAEYLGGGDVGG
jgi:hypothetical protein